MAKRNFSLPSSFQLRFCSHIIRSGGVIAYPTESVYGLGCDPLNEDAVNRILELKLRPVEKGLIVIAADLDQLEPYCQLNQSEREKIQQQNSPATWLVRKSTLTPNWISGKFDKVAIRVTQHPAVKLICNQTQSPIVSTSCNPAGARPASNVLQARQYFHNDIDLYIAGETGIIKSATPIIDIETQVKIRQ